MTDLDELRNAKNVTVGTSAPTPPTVADVKETSRPVLMEETQTGWNCVRRRIHKPVRVNDELDTACERVLLRRLEVRDHFEVRKVAPCRHCFPDGVPFTYEVKQFEPYAMFAGEPEAQHITVNIPSDLIPEGDVTLGGSHE